MQKPFNLKSLYLSLDLLHLMKNNKKHEDRVDNNDHEQDVPPFKQPNDLIKEIGGPKGPEPTRYGDWEKRGRCIDF